MSGSPEMPPELDPAYRSATEWFLRLQSAGLSVEETLEWQAWLRADARHARAFEKVERTWGIFDSVPAPRPATVEELVHDRYDGTTPIGMWRQGKPGTRRPGGAIRARFPLAAVSIALACAAVASLIFIWGRSTRLVFETGVGEMSSISLSDGSFVHLGGDTRVEARFDRHHRSLQLLRGEAYFSIAKDLHRPFSVSQGATRVTAVGTEFDVSLHSDHLLVTVLDGRVLVATDPVQPVRAAGPVRESRQLEAGQRVVVSATGISVPMVTALGGEWRFGRLAFENEPLRDAIEDVNRYATKPIVIESPDIAARRMTGTTSENNVRGWLSSLKLALAIDVKEYPDRIVLKDKSN